MCPGEYVKTEYQKTTVIVEKMAAERRSSKIGVARATHVSWADLTKAS